MTREEAIKILNAIKMLMCRPDGTPISDGCEALDIAIEALSEPQSDDLIIKGAKGIKDGLYNIKDGELFQYKAKGGTVRTYKILSAEQVTGKLESVEIPTVADEESSMSQPKSKLDLISRADAIEAVCGSIMYAFDVSPTRGYDIAEDALSALPSADRPSIVRCGDCKWYKKIVEKSKSGLCHYDLVARCLHDEDFCSHGERGEP